MSDSRAPASLPSYGDTSTSSLLAVVAGRPLHPVVFVVVLGALTALGPFTMDLYLPAFPMVAEDLHTSATMVQVTLTATAVGLGIGQLIVGPLSDAAGRRIPLVGATGLHVVCSVIIVVAPTIELVAIARFGQGCGAAAGAVVASAMVRDVFGGLRLVRIGARIALVNGAAPIIAPVLGSQLLLITTWRGVFAVLALFGLAVLIAAAILFVLVAVHGFTNPCTHVLILADHPNESGTAVALSGFVNSVVGGSLSLLPALLGGVGMLSLGITVTVVSVIALIILWLVVRPRQVAPLSLN